MKPKVVCSVKAVFDLSDIDWDDPGEIAMKFPVQLQDTIATFDFYPTGSIFTFPDMCTQSFGDTSPCNCYGFGLSGFEFESIPTWDLNLDVEPILDIDPIQDIDPIDDSDGKKYVSGYISIQDQTHNDIEEDPRFVSVMFQCGDEFQSVRTRNIADFGEGLGFRPPDFILL